MVSSSNHNIRKQDSLSPSVPGYRRGVLYVVCAGVFLSFGGLFIRQMDSAGPWNVLFYRSLAFSVAVVCFMLLRDGAQSLNRFKRLDRIDWLVSGSLAFGFICYVLSLYSTSVANTVLILSTGPVFAAVLGWVFLRESVPLLTRLAIGAAVLGVAVMMSGDLAGGALQGFVYALVAVFAFAVMIVSLRRVGPHACMLGPIALAGVVAALLSLPFTDGLSISGHDLMWSIALGAIQIGFGFILITLGSRSVPAAQIPLLALAETALAPLWVWLCVNEVPDLRTLTGGAIVLAAVLAQGLVGIRSSRSPAIAPG